MRITPGWRAVLKTNSSLLSAVQHRSLSLNSGIQNGIVAETSRRAPRAKPPYTRDSLDSLQSSVPGAAPRNNSGRASGGFKPSGGRFSRDRERPSQGAPKRYGDTEKWTPRAGPARGGRSGGSGPRRKIIADLDDVDDHQPDRSPWSKAPSRGRNAPPSRRRPSQYEFSDDPVNSSFSRKSGAERSYPPREGRNAGPRRFNDDRKFDGDRRPSRQDHNGDRNFDRDDRKFSSDRRPARNGRYEDRKFSGDRKFSSDRRPAQNDRNGDRQFDRDRRPSRRGRDDDSAPAFRRSASAPAGRTFERREPAPRTSDDAEPYTPRNRSASSAPPPSDELPLRERRKAAIGRKFEAETQRKDDEEARVRGPFGAVPDDMDDMPPKRFPLASAASEMVYGRNAIVAALRGGRRKAYKLWVCQRAFVDKDRNWHECRREAAEIEKLVQEVGAEVAFVSRHWLPLMDAVAGYRQHNVSRVEWWFGADLARV